MGEVWRATDLRLGREVAVKVLPDSLIADPEHLARFQREARLLASMSHPRIAALYDLGEDAGRHFLVMELVEGETLSARLERGPMRPAEALQVACQVAEAVAAAHAQGVVHRDLKPGNVMLTEDGDVKVLDFGLAKGTASEATTSGPELSQSPTLSLQATAAGTVLGTAAYMSPEQARGRPVDARTDVWSWGCVVFEMLTGRRVFEGETVADILAAILRTEPRWGDLPPDLPAAIEPVLRLCLAPDPRERLSDLSDARLLLLRPIGPAVHRPVGSVPPPSPGSRIRKAIAWIAALAAVVGAFVLGSRNPVEAGREDEPLTRLTVPLGEEPLAKIDQILVAISPDGRTIAYTTEDPATGTTAIRTRRLDRPDPEPVTGTGSGGTAPFFSPDGTRLGFFAGDRLQQVDLAGGGPVDLAHAPQARGAVWRVDDTIVYSPFWAGGLWVVPAGGGEGRELVGREPEAGERTLRWPALWPDGLSILFTVGAVGSPNDYDQATLHLWDASTGERSVLVENAQAGAILAPDLLVFARRGVLHGIRLDVEGRRTVGTATPLVDRVFEDPSSGAVQFAISATGTLLWSAGEARGTLARLLLVDREGDVAPLGVEPLAFVHPTFSPDGETLAFTVGKNARGARGDLYTLSLGDESPSRLTFDDSGVHPSWSPDGSEIVFNDGAGSLVAKRADGTGSPRSIPTSGIEGVKLPAAWSPDGKTLALTVVGTSLPEIWIVSEGQSSLFERDASLPVFSPDGKWLAYSQPASGAGHVFVRPVVGDGKWQISPDFGSYARWPAKAGVIQYVAIENADSGGRPLLEVEVSTDGGRVRTGAPRVVLETTLGYVTATSPVRNWDSSPDGNRFVFVERHRDDQTGRALEIAIGWGASVARSFD